MPHHSGIGLSLSAGSRTQHDCFRSLEESPYARMTAIPSPAHTMKSRILIGANLPDRPWSGVVILSLLLLSPLPLASELMRVDSSEGQALQISFTPHLTPLNLTFTPHPTPLQTLGPRVSPPHSRLSQSEHLCRSCLSVAAILQWGSTSLKAQTRQRGAFGSRGK